MRRNSLAAPSGTVVDYLYDEDSAGNITQVHGAIDAKYNRDFAYDDLNRLTMANTGASLWGSGSYTYDSMGNMRSLALGSGRSAMFSYVGATPKLANVVESGGNRNVTYDSNGNEISVGTVSYAYSPRNLLDTAGDTSYSYDGRGVRTTANVPLSVTSLVVDSPSVTGGLPVNATVSLNAPAPLGGATLAITSSGAASVPPTLTVAEGSATATFSITTNAVATQASAVITVSLGSSSRSVQLTILPAAVATLTLNPASVGGGSSSTATLSLTGPAPATGIQVTITTSNTVASAPGNVVVPNGASTATVVVQTSTVAADTAVVITATANGTSQQATLLVRAARLASAILTPDSITAGEGATLTVSLDGPAPTSGAIVALASDRLEAKVAPSVTITAGATSATASITTSIVSTTTAATITATYSGISKNATLTLNPPPVVLASLSLAPATVVGGLPVTGTVTLTLAAPPAGAIASLTSDDSSTAAVPPSVTIAAGATSASFPVSTTTLLSSAVVTITATFNGLSKSTALTVQPPATLALYRLTIDPPNVAGGSSAVGTVTLTGAAPNGGADVPLTSSDPAVATTPTRVTVKRGDTAATFTIATRAVTTAATVDIAGSYGGLTQRDSLTVIPPSAITLLQLTLNPSSVTVGATAAGTVTMSAPAPAGGVLVSVAVKHRNVATAPSSVIVPGSATSASFTITAERVHTAKTTDVSATYAGVTRTATLTVTPATAQWLGMEENVPVALSVPAQFAPKLESVPMAGRRISLYTPELNLMAETEITNTPTPATAYEYIWFGGKPVAQVETSTGAIHYYFTDHLGTPILQTNSSGAIDWRAEYEPYGDVFTFRAGAARHQPLRFPGQEYDDGGRAYNIFRWYRGSWSRYTQADPMGLHGGLNVYRYANANPVGATDSTGLAVNLICRRVNVGQGLLARLVGAWLVPVHCRLQVSCLCSDGQSDPRAPFNRTIGLEATGGGYQLNTDQYLAPRWGGPSQDYERGWFNVPVTPPGGASGCSFERCLLNEARARENTQAFPTYRIAGPNSNSYVRNLVDTCGGSAEWPPNAYGANPNPYYGGYYQP